MSRLGNKPIDIPDGVKVTLESSGILVEGPIGKISQKITTPVKVNMDTTAKKIVVQCDSKEKSHKALHGLTRSLIANMIVGASKGYEKILDINGVGYNAKVQGKQLVMQLGFSHPVIMDIPDGLTVTCPTQTSISVKGVDKALVGELSAEIRFKRSVEPYNLKGIKYRDEVVKRKAGKTFVSGTT